MEEKKEHSLADIGSVKKDKKKIKDLIAAIILLLGVLGGSLVVDVIQLIGGKGYTPIKLSKADIFETGGRTWVAYSEPIIKVKVFADESCEECRPDEALVWMRKIVPTILTQKIDTSSEDGKKYISLFKIKTLPAFVFSSEINKTEFFNQAEALFEKTDNDNYYIFKAAEVGIPIGKYIETPKIGEGDIKIGPDDAKVKIIEFSDFQCPFCKNIHPVIKKTIEEYGNNIQYVFKNFPLDFHSQAENAALAGMCANEQGKFLIYADKLFSLQEDWGKSSGTQKFKNYARQTGLNNQQFDKCLDEKKYSEKISADMSEGKNFGVSGTPATFINGQFRNGAISYEDLKKSIEDEFGRVNKE